MRLISCEFAYLLGSYPNILERLRTRFLHFVNTGNETVSRAFQFKSDAKSNSVILINFI